MTRAIFLVLIFAILALTENAISVLAENKVWTGKALGYKGESAELYVGLDGFNDLETAVKVGTIASNGRFSFELPQEIPDESPTRPDLREDCGDVTAGLKIGALASVLVKTQAGIVGEMQHSNRASALKDIGNLKSGQGTKLTAWFYSNRNGILKEDCTEGDLRQVSDVVFQKGWNVLTAYYFQKDDNLMIKIRNGYTEGLQRWFFVPPQSDPLMP